MAATRRYAEGSVVVWLAEDGVRLVDEELVRFVLLEQTGGPAGGAVKDAGQDGSSPWLSEALAPVPLDFGAGGHVRLAEEARLESAAADSGPQGHRGDPELIGGFVVLRTMKDRREKYGRYLGILFVHGTDVESVNDAMLRLGLAKAYLP